MTSSKKANWKDHPLAIAAICVVTTIGFCILVLSEVILPTYKERINNQLAELPKLRKEISRAEKRIIELENEIKGIQVELISARNLNLFSTGNPYPSGLEVIKIGDNIDRVTEVFSASQINRNTDRYWSVTIQNSPVESATYYFDTTSKPKKIMMIGIFFKNTSNSHKALNRLLIEALGTPKLENDINLLWFLNGNLKVSLSKISASYTISEQ